MLKAECIEWVLALATLLIDPSVVPQVVECVERVGEMEGGVAMRILQGMEELNSWAMAEW